MANLYQFGMGEGHLPKGKVKRVLHDHPGAELVNYTEPGNGRKRHWFNLENWGQAQNSERAKAVLADLRRAGILAEAR
jgi:hypothetical protein